MNTKILVPIIALALMASGLSYGTFAFFADTETSTGNLFSAGTLDLTTNGAQGTTASIGDANFAPGATASGSVALARAVGTLSAVDLDFSASMTVTDDDGAQTGGTCTDAEQMDKSIEITVLTYDGVDLLPQVADADTDGRKSLDDLEAAGAITDLADPGTAGKTLAMTVQFINDAPTCNQADSVDMTLTFLLAQVDAADLGGAGGGGGGGGGSGTAGTPGDQLWTDIHNGANNGGEWMANFKGVAVSPDSSTFYATGKVDNGGSVGTDWHTAAYDAITGVELWAVDYNGPQSSWDDPYSICVSPDGSKVFVAGTVTVDGTGNNDIGAVAFDAATGAQIWESNWRPSPGATANESVREVECSQDGSKIYVVGATGTPLSGTLLDGVTIAYDAADGTELWAAQYNGPSTNYDDGQAVAASPDGSRVYSAIMGWDGSKYSFDLVAYDSTTGAQQWVQRYFGLGGHDVPYGVEVTSDSSTILIGGNSNNGVDDDFAVVAYSSGGTQQWVQRYDSGNGADGGYRLAIAPDDSNVYIIGHASNGAGNRDGTVVAYAIADGTQQWVAAYDGPAALNDWAQDIDVSPDGSRVYLVMNSDDAGSVYDAAVAAFDSATGATTWSARYAGPDGLADRAMTVVASPDGARLFVGGVSQSSTTSNDLLFLTYAT